MLLRHLTDIHTIDQHTASIHIVKTRYQADQRRFASTSAPNDRCHLTWPGTKGNVGQSWLFRSWIAEGHILKLDIAPLTIRYLHMFGIINLRLHSQHFINTLGRSFGTWKHDKHHRNH